MTIVENVREDLKTQIAATQRQIDRILGQTPEPIGRPGEEWGMRLARLPASCQLRKIYDQFDAARVAWEVADERWQRWSNELSTIVRQQKDVDPDAPGATDAYSVGFIRAAMLSDKLKETKELLAELAQRKDRAADTWGKTWHSYIEAHREVEHIRANPDGASMLGTFDMDSSPRLKELRATIRYAEMAQGI